MKHRVAIVAHHALGGSGVMAVEWAHLLAARGHEVHLVRCGRSARDGMPRAVGAGAPVLHELSAPSHPVLDGPSAVAAVTSRLVQLHEQAPLDVVHIHYALPFALAVPALRTLPSPPRCVVSLHGSDVTGVGGDPAYAPAMGLALRSAHAVTVPSRWLALEAQDRGIAQASAIDVLPNFVDLEHFTPAPPVSPRPTVVQAFGDDDGTPVVLHMSNLRAVKRADDTVEILAALRRATPGRLLLVGDGPGREALRERARRELGASVGWVGAVQDPAPYFRDADCLLLPSETESFGLVALEALACGTPVVASRAGGLPGWLADVPAAALCPVGDHEAFAAALAGFLARGRGALSASARGSAESIGAASVAASVAESLYTRPASPPTAPGETPCWPSPS